MGSDPEFGTRCSIRTPPAPTPAPTPVPHAWAFLTASFPMPPQGEDGDYQPVSAMAALERQELNYAALEFMGVRPRDGASAQGDDGSDYTEIKAK